MRIAFYKGKDRAFNRFVSWWTRGPYSHAEAVLESARDLDRPLMCASSSFMDGGVRIKQILLTPDHWDVLDVPAFDSLKVLAWFEQRKTAKYDFVGLLSTSMPVPHRANRWFCNEAIGEAAGLTNAWRFSPNGFADVCALLPGSVWERGGPVEADAMPAAVGA